MNGNIGYQHIWTNSLICNGNPTVSYNITLKGGKCSTMNCFAINETIYNNENCKGNSFQMLINIWSLWLPRQCFDSAIQSCMSGNPFLTLYNNSGIHYFMYVSRHFFF